MDKRLKILWIAALCFFVTSAFLVNGDSYLGDYDEGVYLSTAKKVAGGSKLYSEAFSAQPPLWPELLGLAYSQGGIYGVKALLALFATLSLLFSFLLARLVVSANRVSWQATSIFFFMSPLFIFLSRGVYAEVGSTALTLGALFAAWHAWVSPKSRTRALLWAMFCGLMISMAVLMKLSAVYSFLAFLVVIGLDALIRQQWSSVFTKIIGFCCTGLVPLALVLATYSWEPFFEQVVGFHTDVLDGQYSVQGLGIPLFLFFSLITDLGLMLFGFVGLRWVWLERKRDFVGHSYLLAIFGANLLFLTLHSPAFMHHGIVLGVPMLIFAWIGALQTIKRGFKFTLIFKKPTLVHACYTVCMPLLMFNAGYLLFNDYAKTEKIKERVAAVESICQSGETILTDLQIVAFIANCNLPPDMIDTSNVRIKSGNLTLKDIENAVQRDNIEILLLDSRLKKIAGFNDWLNHHYALVNEEVGLWKLKRKVANG